VKSKNPERLEEEGPGRPPGAEGARRRLCVVCGGTAVLPYRTTLLGRAHSIVRQLVLGVLSNTWGYGGVQRVLRGGMRAGEVLATLGRRGRS